MKIHAICKMRKLAPQSKYYWLSNDYICVVRHLCFAAKTLVSDV